MRILIAALLLIGLAAPALAQEEPPIPRPRPDRGEAVVQPAPSADAPAAESERLLEEPPEASALAPTVDGAQPEAVTAIDSAVGAPQPVVLSAQVTDEGPSIPSGLVWRIFDTRTNAAGELALVAKSDEAMASFTLNPGQYIVHVAYGRAQASDTLDVAVGGNAKKMILDAGGLRLSAAIAGDVPIPPGLLRFDVMSGEGGERQMIVEGAAPNDVLTLNSGTYHVVSHFGAINAVVRADLRVEAGQLTDATLFHRAAQIAFKLVSESGGEAIADVEWTVKTNTGETVFTALGAVPSTVLAEGDYLVLAKRGEQVFNREFDVLAGQPVDVDVLTTVR